MKVYLHSDNAEKSANYVVTVAPAGDTTFNKAGKDGFPKDWVQADGTPKQFQVVFVFGAAEVDDAIGKYMVARGIAHPGRMLRKIFQLFSRDGIPIEEVFDRDGNRVFLDGQAA